MICRNKKFRSAALLFASVSLSHDDGKDNDRRKAYRTDTDDPDRSDTRVDTVFLYFIRIELRTLLDVKQRMGRGCDDRGVSSGIGSIRLTVL